MTHGLGGKIDGVFCIEGCGLRLILGTGPVVPAHGVWQLLQQDLLHAPVIVRLRGSQGSGAGGAAGADALIQQQILYKMYNPQKLAAEAEAREKLEKEAAKKARSEKVIVVDADGTQREVERQVSEKEANRRRLAEARRRDAEKYGETYVEVEDKDLE